MAEKKRFDLGAALAAVSESDTQPDRAQIVRYDVDAIFPDPDNFYSMSGIDELMASIELVGLQQPLLVRPHPDKAAAVMVVSGHRRREAIRRLVAEGREDLRMVPCLVEAQAASAELQELKLIYANSDTRHLSSAEISAQAARVEELLYKLKEQGYEFPGRMRDHVAEACKVSKTKLARLKMIRDNLSKDWQKRWTKSEIAESVAYRLAQCSPEHQRILFAHLGAERYVYESTVEGYDKRISDAEASKHPRGGACENIENKLQCVMKRNAYADNYCKGCCGDCPNLASCKFSCIRQKDKAARLKADKRAQAQQEKAAKAAEKQPKLDMVRTVWQRWDAARKAAGKTVKEMCDACSYFYSEQREQMIAEIVEGKAKINEYQELPVGLARSYELIGLVRTADALGVSVDYLLGRSENPELNTGSPSSAKPLSEGAVRPIWHTSTEAVPAGRLILTWNMTNDGEVYRAAISDGDRFVDTKAAHKELTGLRFFRWMEIPPVPSFRAGDPDQTTLAWCAFNVDGRELTTSAVWKPDLGKWCFEHGAAIDAECIGWIPLPDWKGVLRDKEGGGRT